jgi:hypothetical protein
MTEACRTLKPERQPVGSGSLVDAMMRPEFYTDSPVRVELKQTHISYVFLAGDHVYKVKKPVHFEFLDCSQLAQRFHYCCEEVRLNARLSPRVYLGVFAILKDADPSFRNHLSDPSLTFFGYAMRRGSGMPYLSPSLRRFAGGLERL